MCEIFFNKDLTMQQIFTCIDFIIFNVVAITTTPIMANILDKYHVQIQICDSSMTNLYC
jgi:hypothetical protein